MGQDIVKGVLLNGKLLQTGRDVLSGAALVGLAGFAPGARVDVTWREKGSTASSAVRLEREDEVEVEAGMVFEVKFRA